MKLYTSIIPRRDGSLYAAGLDGIKYSFVPDADGQLACDIEDAATVSKLLSGGDFFPADELDNETAFALIQAPATDADASYGGPDPDGDDPIDPNALPVEAQTIPKPRRQRSDKGASRA